MSGNYGFFQNKECQYFPCHKVETDEKDIEDVIERFRFEKSDKRRLMSIMETAYPFLRGEFGYLKLPKDKGFSAIKYDDYVIGAVTLGEGIDELTELYLKYDQVSEAYMLDCFGLKLLSKAYEVMAEAVEAYTKKQVIKLDFLEGDYPTNLMGNILKTLEMESISISEGNMLKPLKSVCLILPLEEPDINNGARRCSIGDICADCSNVNCSIRRMAVTDNKSTALTYGYMRIFGNKTGTFEKNE